MDYFIYFYFLLHQTYFAIIWQNNKTSGEIVEHSNGFVSVGHEKILDVYDRKPSTKDIANLKCTVKHSLGEVSFSDDTT